MAKSRVHELAKELEIDNKRILDFLEEKGIVGKNQLSALEDDQEAMVRKAFAPKKKEAAPAGADDAAKAEPVKKKKKIMAVFRPQNATSREGKNFHRTGSAPAGGRTERRDGAQTRQAKPQKDAAKAPHTPLVKVPRPQPMFRNTEPPQPKKPVQKRPAQPAPEAVEPAALKAAEEAAAAQNAAAAQSAAAEAAAAEAAKASAAEAANASAAEAAAGAAVQEAQTAAKAGSAAETPAAEEAAAAAASAREQAPRNEAAGRRAEGTPSAEQAQGQRSYGDRPQGQRSYGDRPQGQRSYGDRPQGQRSYGDRPQGQRSYGDRPQGQRSYGDRPQGQRPYGDRPQGQRPYGDRPQGQRPFGDRPQGQRPFGDRPQGGRPGFGTGTAQGRPGGFGTRDGGSRFGQNRPAGGGRPAGGRPAGGSMDMGVKKPGRDAGHNRDKDKNKVDKRDNKFATDSRNGRSGQKNMLPKALQKPVHRQKDEKKEEIREITLPEKLTIRELAEKMKMQPSVIVKSLFLKGEICTVNQEIDYDKAEEIALEYDIIATPEEKVDVIAELLKEDEEDEAAMVSRPPVVCVMGHVDHGKTSLLDAIRDAHVTDREAGGITQNIGAYGVKINGRRITFLDTPGHEAFTAMRMRGANSTDIAVLVVAADDGVMPQTIEAINHARAANVEIIVAINKIDKPGANIDRVKQELSEQGLIPEDWGGSTVFAEVSAKTHEGIENLLELILLTADILELKANPARKARGLVLEAKLDKGKGPVANILVQKGTLHVGDYIACGAASGKVRAMMDENSRRLKEAGPSTPVEVLGLNDVPNAGEILVATDTDKEAKNIAATFISEGKNKLLEETKSRMSLDDLFSQIKEGTLQELNLIVKADVQGSVEALKQSLLKLTNEEVMVKVIHSGVGAISESDISLASASNAIVVGFNVRPDATAKSMADQEKVDVRLYKVIYQAIDDIEAAMKGMLAPVYEEKVTGHAEIRQLFRASGIGTIAGSYVTDGNIQRGCKVRIRRGETQIFEGNLASLKRFKDDVKEVRSGYECGLVFEGFNEIQELDTVEAYIMVEVPRS